MVSFQPSPAFLSRQKRLEDAFNLVQAGHVLKSQMDLLIDHN
jgi:hypothetical protein